MNKGLADYQSNQRINALSILQRIAKTDKSAVADCIDAYGSLVWTTARKYTHSTDEAEIMVEKIFKDIWNCASKYDPADGTEERYILRIIFRHLIKHLFLNAKSLSPLESISLPYSKNEGIRKKLQQI